MQLNGIAYTLSQNSLKHFAGTTDKSHFAHIARTPPLPSFNVAFTTFLSLPLTKTNKFNIEGDRAKETAGDCFNIYGEFVRLIRIQSHKNLDEMAMTATLLHKPALRYPVSLLILLALMRASFGVRTLPAAIRLFILPWL